MKLLLTLLIAILVPGSAQAQPTNELSGINRCLGALNADIQVVESKKPRMSSEFAKGIKGWLLLGLDSDSPVDVETIGSIKDLHLCIGAGAKVSDIEMLMKSFSGLFPQDPLEDLAKCVAALKIMETVATREYGKKKADELMNYLYGTAGSALVQLRYIYSDVDGTIESVNAVAESLVTRLDGKTLEQRMRIVGHYKKLCEWYGVPLEATITGAEAIAR